MSEATQDTIGKILNGDKERDAIHIAVAPTIAATTLQPGQRVGLNDQGAAVSIVGKNIGIVDPFLVGPVKAGEQFWLFLYPNTIQGLRHQWSHPAYDGIEAKARAASEKWLREFAANNFVPYDEPPGYDAYAELLKAAEEGDFCFSGQPDELYQSGPQQEFWGHLETVRGKPFTTKHKANASFRCSC